MSRFDKPSVPPKPEEDEIDVDVSEFNDPKKTPQVGWGHREFTEEELSQDFAPNPTLERLLAADIADQFFKDDIGKNGPFHRLFNDENGVLDADMVQEFKDKLFTLISSERTERPLKGIPTSAEVERREESRMNRLEDIRDRVLAQAADVAREILQKRDKEEQDKLYRKKGAA